MRSLILAAALALALPAAAEAHAHLVHASPAVGSTVARAPSEVVIWFTRDLEPAFSDIEVSDEKGVAMQDGKATVDPSSRTQLRVHLKPLPPGTYTVNWRVLSVDTHRTQGNFTFHVGQ